jgi:hypothetical protein
MTLDELKSRAADLFPAAVEHAVKNPGLSNSPLEEFKSICWTNFENLGFDCMADCFDAAVPKSEGELSLTSWSDGEVSVVPWTIRVRCRSFHISLRDVHLELRHNGPLPGITETGYRSVFVPLSKFSSMTPEEFVRTEICSKLPTTQQLTLF